MNKYDFGVNPCSEIGSDFKLQNLSIVGRKIIEFNGICVVIVERPSMIDLFDCGNAKKITLVGTSNIPDKTYGENFVIFVPMSRNKSYTDPISSIHHELIYKANAVVFTEEKGDGIFNFRIEKNRWGSQHELSINVKNIIRVEKLNLIL